MGLEFPKQEGEETQIFLHSKEYQQGQGNIRKGASTIVVALDGSGDADTLQDALNIIPSGGGIIVIKEGTYDLGSAPLTIDKSNIKIEGSGYATILTRTTGAAGFILEFGAGTTTRKNLIIENLKFDGSSDTYKGIELDKVEDCRVQNCNFEGIKDYSIRVESDSAKNMITLNNISGSISGEFIFVAGERNVIQGNIIETSTTDQIGIDVIGDKNTISGNILENSYIYISGENNVIDGNYTDNNDILNNGGITLDGASNNIVSNNQITGAEWGVLIDTDSDRNVVQGNRIFSNADGILINNANCDKNLIHGNIVFDNTTEITDNGTATIVADNITS